MDDDTWKSRKKALNEKIKEAMRKQGIYPSTSQDVINTNVNLIIRRKKMTLYLATPENTSVLELKKMIEAILKVRPADQQLFLVSEKKDDDTPEYVELDDSNALSNYKLDSVTTSTTYPATLGLTFRQDDDSFENLEITPYSELEWPNIRNFPTGDECEDKKFADAVHEKYERMLKELDRIKSERIKSQTFTERNV